MNCPACNDIVSDNSLFCPNCGKVFDAKVREAELHNTKTPTEIAAVSVWFAPGMEKVKGILGSDSKKLTRKMNFAFQLIDGDKKTTAYDGEVTVKARIYQGYSADYGMSGTQWKYLSDTPLQQRLSARTVEFYRAGQGKLWWKYSHPNAFMITSGYNVSCELEFWFTPRGSTQKLYKKDSFSLDFSA